MTLPTTLRAIRKALRNAGATEEMIAAAVKAGGESGIPHRAREAARKQRERAAWRPPDTPARLPDGVATEALPARLINAGERHIDPMADVGPIAGLVDQGCGASAGRRPCVSDRRGPMSARVPRRPSRCLRTD
jgi:hypothetical protein